MDVFGKHILGFIVGSVMGVFFRELFGHVLGPLDLGKGKTRQPPLQMTCVNMNPLEFIEFKKITLAKRA
jgi:hypothetical protein